MEIGEPLRRWEVVPLSEPISPLEHVEGYRASKARIVSLEGATDNVTDEAFERLRRRYGVRGAESKEQNA